MLPDAPDVENAALGPDGIVSGLKPGSVMIDMSTSALETTRRIGAALVARGCDMVDSPVGKTAEHAVTGTLTLMVGGDEATIARVRPVLDCMGTDFFHCGGLGNGHAMKATNNLLATTLVALNAESYPPMSAYAGAPIGLAISAREVGTYTIEVGCAPGD